MKANDITAPPSSLSGGKSAESRCCQDAEFRSEGSDHGRAYKGVSTLVQNILFYEIMNSLACKGYGIIMVSSEMPEVLGVADRVVVMKSGRVTGEFGDMETVTQEMLLEASLKEREGHK